VSALPRRRTGRRTGNRAVEPRAALDRKLSDLIDAHADAVFRLAFGILHDRQLAEDIVQETMLRSWKALGRFCGDASERTWVLRIAHNAAIDALRRRRDLATDPHDFPDGTDHRDPADRATGMDSLAAVGRALAALDAKNYASAAAQLDEIEGKPGAVVDDKDRTQAQSALAATEASFDLEIEGRALKIAYQGLARCTINYYLMDIELLFSRNPFVGQHAGQSTFIRPNATEERVLDPEKTAAAFEIPAQFQARNVMIEVAGAGIRKSRAYFSNALAVQVIENYGQVKVAAQKDGTALPAVYVKVYARQRDGTVKFYKDGYTDLRGRFDYASLSTDDLDRVERFALLLLSEEHGAVVREAAPPAR